jgi:hypothetical protein
MKVLLTSTLAVVFCTLSMGAVADPDKPRVFQAVPVTNGASGAEDGAAWLRRSKDRVDGRIMTTVDTAGAPHSVWWVIFNNPDGCTDPCGENDVFNASGGAEAEVAVFNASGAISAEDGSGIGVINLDLSVIGGEGAGIGSQVPPPLAINAPFFNRVLKKNNARCAEIHLDIQVHVMDTDWVSELTYPENLQAFAVFPPAPDCK